MNTRSFTRYAKIGSLPIKEQIIFAENDPNHPLSVTLEGENGSWLLDSISDQITTIDVALSIKNREPVNPLIASLKAGVVLITEEEFINMVNANILAETQKIESRRATRTAKKVSREAVLKRLGVTDEELELFK